MYNCNKKKENCNQKIHENMTVVQMYTRNNLYIHIMRVLSLRIFHEMISGMVLQKSFVCAILYWLIGLILGPIFTII